MGDRVGQQGVTLFELLVAVLLLGLVSTMIYSVLNVGISFSAKGEARLVRIGREQGIVTLLKRQVEGAWYEMRRSRVKIVGGQGTLLIATRQPLIHREQGVVLAVYRYNESEGALYYAEKKDFYNTDYNEDYLPDYTEMDLLFSATDPLEISYDSGVDQVRFVHGDREFLFSPKCVAVKNTVILSMRQAQ